MGNTEINTHSHYPKGLMQKSQEQRDAFESYSNSPDYINSRAKIELEKAEKTMQILSESKAAKENLKKDIQQITYERKYDSNVSIKQEKNGEEDDENDNDGITRVIELSQDEFFHKMKEISLNVYKKYGAPHPRVILGQALYETGFGKSGVAKNKNNLFGFRLKNKERGVFEYIRYASMEEATEAYADKMVNSQYYSKTLKHKDDPKKYITALIKAGYCSTPPSKYIANIESCLNKYGLSLEDKIEDA